MSSPSGDAGSAAMGDGPEDQQAAAKRKRNLPGTPDPEAEVIALSPKTLMETNRFLCDVCGKGFQRDQNLQLHRRGHNLPWKLKQRDGQGIKKRVYVCPESSCVHHHPSRALGDLTGIKKHFSRKHGEKKWKCEKCSKQYAVHSDWKAHQKVCGTREYRCDCGTLFSRRDSFITHRAFCDALLQENARILANRQVETQQSSGPDGSVLVSQVGEPSSAMEAPSSPLQPIATVAEPVLRDSWEPDSTLNEDTVFPLTSNRVSGGLAVTLHRQSKDPGLSLCLGTGLGPGPPRASEMVGSLPQTEGKPASKQMNTLVSVDSVRDERTRWPLPLASAGIFTSMLTAANSDSESLGYASGRYASNGMAALSMGMNSLIGSSTASQFANSTFVESGFVPSKHHWQHAGGAQLPATTLLQKAAMMGSTKASSFLFRNFGVGEDLDSLSSGESRQHDLWAGVTSSLTSSWHSSLRMGPAAEGLRLDCGPGYEASGATLDGRQDNVQEFRESLHSGGGGLENISHVASSSLSTVRDFTLDGKNDHQKVHEGFRNQDVIACTELEGSQREDRHEANRMTLDFLGVGGHIRSGGVALSMGEDLSQRDVVSINSLNAGLKPEPFIYLEENMETRTGEGHSPLSEG